MLLLQAVSVVVNVVCCSCCIWLVLLVLMFKAAWMSIAKLGRPEAARCCSPAHPTLVASTSAAQSRPSATLMASMISNSYIVACTLAVAVQWRCWRTADDHHNYDHAFSANSSTSTVAKNNNAQQTNNEQRTTDNEHQTTTNQHAK